MATLERLSQPGPSSLADEEGSASLAPSVPSPFPSDELVALRSFDAHDGGLPRPREVSIFSLEAPSSSDGHLPPGYDDDETNPFLDPHHPHHPNHLPPPSLDDDDANHIPPTYPHDERAPFVDHEDYPRDKPSNSNGPSSSSQSASEEKMRLDLDSVTAAISRLYDVAPQMGDQRVELNARKRDEMDLARMVGRGKMTDQVAESSLKGKARETKEQELGQIWERIEQAHGRRLNGQEAEMRPSGRASAKKERDLKVSLNDDGKEEERGIDEFDGRGLTFLTFRSPLSLSRRNKPSWKESQIVLQPVECTDKTRLLPRSLPPPRRRPRSHKTSSR